MHKTTRHLYQTTALRKDFTLLKRCTTRAGQTRFLTQVELLVNSFVSTDEAFVIKVISYFLAGFMSKFLKISFPGIYPMKSYSCIPGYEHIDGTKIKCPDPKDVKPFTFVYHVWYMFVPFYFCAAGIAFYFPYTVFRHLSGVYDVKPMLYSLNCSIEVREHAAQVVTLNS